MAQVLVGLGSNLGTRRAWLHLALVGLRGLARGGLLRRSPLYRSPPMGPPQPDYLNAVVALHWDGAPEALLGELHRLEQALLRRREARWGPRTVDLDLLWMEGVERDSPRLTVPHPGWLHRPFTVVPALAVAPASAREALWTARRSLSTESLAGLRPVRWVAAGPDLRGSRAPSVPTVGPRRLPGPGRWQRVVGRDARDCARRAARRGGRLLAWAPVPGGGVEGVAARPRAGPRARSAPLARADSKL